MVRIVQNVHILVINFEILFFFSKYFVDKNSLKISKLSVCRTKKYFERATPPPPPSKGGSLCLDGHPLIILVGKNPGRIFREGVRPFRG